MIQTALALLVAHMLADYVFQTRWMIDNKRRAEVFGLHGLIVAVLSFLALGGSWMLVLAVTVAHLLIDLIKLFVLPEKLWVYLVDQAAHIGVIAVAAFWMPLAFSQGYWGALPPETLTTLSDAALLLIGLLAATLAGGPGVGLLMQRFSDGALPDGIAGAGRMIGLLERGIIFLMVIIGQPAGIGFLIAAKSILRFDMASKNQHASEYVIIGTLASFGWAIVVGFATQAILETLS